MDPNVQQQAPQTQSGQQTTVSPNTPATPAPESSPRDYPGRTVGIVGLILVFISSLIGLIVSIIARKKSKKAGFKNTPAKLGIILGSIFLAIGLIVGIIYAVTFGPIILKCHQSGVNGVVMNGVEYDCGGSPNRSSDNRADRSIEDEIIE